MISHDMPLFSLIGDAEFKTEPSLLEERFMTPKVLQAFGNLQNNKAACPDGVQDKHLKRAFVLVSYWTVFLIVYMLGGRIHRYW